MTTDDKQVIRRASGGSVLLFHCPGCKCAHAVNIDPTRQPCWTFNGDDAKPTIQPSVLCNGNAKFKNPTMPRCHSFVTDGQIRFLSDCDHDLAGQTIPLEAF